MAKDESSVRLTALAKNRDYYDGVIATHYAGLKDRFFGPDVTDANVIQQYEVPIENASRIAILKHTGLVPTEATFAAKRKKSTSGEPDKKLTESLNKWAFGDNHGPGVSINEWTPEILVRLCIDGEFPIKIIIRDTIPIGRWIDDYGFEIDSPDDNIFQIDGYSAEYEANDEDAGSVSQKIITEIFDDQATRVSQDGNELPEPYTWEHNLGWTPVVVIKRSDIVGDKHGRSLMSDLIEPQDQVNWANMGIHRANKYGAYPVFAAKTDNAPEADVAIKPNCIFTVPMERITADGASDAAFDQRSNSLTNLFAMAGLKDTTQEEVSQAPNTSGKALLILNAEGRRMVASLLSRLTRGYTLYSQMFLALTEGGVPGDYDVTVTFPSLDQDDPVFMLEKAKFLELAGSTREAYRALGYDEEKVDLLMAERDEPVELMPPDFNPDDQDGQEEEEVEGEDDESNDR